MNPGTVIRSKTPDDRDAITKVAIAAFKALPISQHTEQFIVEALRDAKALAVSLVAEVDSRIIGHSAFSVSVLPEYQRQGIGNALIEQGLSHLKALNAQGCCLVGYPEYDGKFGFEKMSGLVHEGVPPEVFLALSFDGTIPQGVVDCHEAFNADGPQKGTGDA